MILGYGSYRHQANEVMVVIDQTPSTNSAGVRDKTKHRWTINGVLQASTVAEMTAAIRALENAYKSNGKDLVLYDADGSTATAHKLLSNTSLSGTRVISGPSYPIGNEVISLMRRYTIVVECETSVLPDSVGDGSGGQQNAPLRFSETVQQYGGGEIVMHMTLLDGKPFRQVTAKHSPFIVVQSGQATGERGYPKIPAPLFKKDLKENPRLDFTLTPSNEGSQNKPKVLFTASWSYLFESAKKLKLKPRRR